MSYDEQLAERVRRLLDGRPDLSEKHMFGSRAFLLGGNLCCCVTGDELMVRAGPEQAARLLATEPATRAMDMTGRPMRGWVLVAAEALAEDEDLARWVDLAEDFASGLPPKG